VGGWSWDDEVPTDPTAIRIAENARRQTLRLSELVGKAVANPEQVPITIPLLQEINRLGVEGLIDEPDTIRTRDIEIVASRHVPPPWQDVPEHLRKMCDYLNSGPNRDPVHLAAYAVWRLNWIHPFGDGNGRTSRALAYLVLCAASERELRGETHFVELLTRHERRYTRALEAADNADLQGRIDVTEAEQLIVELVREQLATDPEAPATG
jgi:Fic family protein